MQTDGNQNYNEIQPHMDQNGHHQKNLQTINAGEDAEKRGLSYTTGGNLNGYNHDEEEYRGSLKNYV